MVYKLFYLVYAHDMSRKKWNVEAPTGRLSGIKKYSPRQKWENIKKNVYDKKINSDPKSEIQVIEFRRLQTLMFSQ
jgi:hypothetical protein